MRLAWFAAHTPATNQSLDDTPSLVAELGSRHEIVSYDEQRAPDFVWQHWRRPFDLCVYDLTDSPAAAFAWPYLLHYPGVVRLRSNSLHRGRRDRLDRTHRQQDAAVEVAFAGYDALRIPLLASKAAVVGDEYAASLLAAEHPGTLIRHAPPAIAATPTLSADRGNARFVVTEPSTAHVAAAAVRRAREAGVMVETTGAEALERRAAGDVVIALEWPPRPELPSASVSAMAAGLPVIVYETTVTAAWPTLDPQTWQPRTLLGSADAIAVSIDPMDDEHSLMLAIRRLATDAALRQRLGRAGQAWWRAHATPAHAAAAWESILAEAATASVPPRPADWPSHLTADGTGEARALLGEFGVTVDFLV